MSEVRGMRVCWWVAGGSGGRGWRGRAAAAAGSKLAVRHGPQHAAHARRALGPERPRPPAQPAQRTGVDLQSPHFSHDVSPAQIGSTPPKLLTSLLRCKTSHLLTKDASSMTDA